MAIKKEVDANDSEVIGRRMVIHEIQVVTVPISAVESKRVKIGIVMIPIPLFIKLTRMYTTDAFRTLFSLLSDLPIFEPLKTTQSISPIFAFLDQSAL